MLKHGQFANGGFPQVWNTLPRERAPSPSQRATFPETWSRDYQGHQEYWMQPTLNDNLMSDVLDTLFLAADVYDEPRYYHAALQAADFLLLAQMPEPQPAWAQQYDTAMHPIWARKFEPPAITGGESQAVIRSLLDVFRRTGDQRYLEPIPKALAYLEASTLPDGRLARFYELRTNTPLYFTRSYELTEDDRDLPAHYGFTVSSNLAKLRRDFGKLRSLTPDERTFLAQRTAPFPLPEKKVSEKAVRGIVDALDDRGAWVTNDGLRYHKQPGPVIDMRQTVANLCTLADYLATPSAVK
jgi:hypothetical protein